MIRESWQTGRSCCGVPLVRLFSLFRALLNVVVLLGTNKKTYSAPDLGQEVIVCIIGWGNEGSGHVIVMLL